MKNKVWWKSSVLISNLFQLKENIVSLKTKKMKKN